MFGYTGNSAPISEEISNLICQRFIPFCSQLGLERVCGLCLAKVIQNNFLILLYLQKTGSPYGILYEMF